jgi:hypothetical protein
MSREIPNRDALLLQCAAFAGNEPPGSFLEIRPLRPLGRQEFVPVRELGTAIEAVMRLRDQYEVFLGLNPRTARSGRAEHVERSWCLVADCDSPASVARLRAFMPRPGIVVASSPGKAHAYWPLRRPVESEWARRANLRVAHALGADRNCCDPARVMRAVGTVNRKRAPAPVRCLRLELDVFDLADVVGRLADDPRTRPRAAAPAPRSAASPRLVQGAADVVRGAQEGNRNAALNWSAYQLGQRVGAGELDEQEVRAELRAAGAAAGLDDIEIERTIESGLQAGMAA